MEGGSVSGRTVMVKLQRSVSRQPSTTVQLTALGRRPLGWPYNFEADVIAKTVVAWLERREG